MNICFASAECIKSVFIHVASFYAYLLKQKKEKSSSLRGFAWYSSMVAVALSETLLSIANKMLQSIILNKKSCYFF